MTGREPEGTWFHGADSHVRNEGYESYDSYHVKVVRPSRRFIPRRSLLPPLTTVVATADLRSCPAARVCTEYAALPLHQTVPHEYEVA